MKYSTWQQREMDQLYMTSQVSNITRKTKFAHWLTCFPRLNKKSAKTETKAQIKLH